MLNTIRFISALLCMLFLPLGAMQVPSDLRSFDPWSIEARAGLDQEGEKAYAVLRKYCEDEKYHWMARELLSCKILGMPDQFAELENKLTHHYNRLVDAPYGRGKAIEKQAEKRYVALFKALHMFRQSVENRIASEKAHEEEFGD